GCREGAGKGETGPEHPGSRGRSAPPGTTVSWKILDRAASVPAGRRFSTGGREVPPPVRPDRSPGSRVLANAAFPGLLNPSGTSRFLSLTVAGAAPDSNRLPVHPFAWPSYASSLPGARNDFQKRALHVDGACLFQ